MSLRITNLKSFEDNVSKFADKLMLSTNVVIKKVAFDIYKGVNEKTPVATGYARASWNISPHHPDPSVKNKNQYPPGRKASARQGKQGAENLSKVRVANSVRDAERWFITNNVPYIIYLEAGHSKQSRHMVTRTLNEVQANFTQLLKDIK